MGRNTSDRLHFMKLTATELEQDAGKHPSQWSAHQIRTFHDALYDLIEAAYLSNKSLETADIYGIALSKSRYKISLSEESFKNHFSKKRTADFRDYTCNRYALYLASKVTCNKQITTWIQYLAFATQSTTKEGMTKDWEHKIRTIYCTQSKFQSIPILESNVLGLKTLPMKEYFADVSYAPLSTLHRKELLLQKEKQQFSQFKLYKSALQNDAFLTQKNLEDYRRILILGNPGTGKTIYARWLCNQWANRQLKVNGIPIYIELKKVNFNSKTPIFDYLKTWIECTLNMTIEQSFLHPEMLAQFFWVLDGFDEIGFDQQDKLLSILSIKCANAKFMLLSRPYAMLDYEDRVNVDGIIELLGFGKNSQKRYVQKILQTSETTLTSEVFWDLVQSQPFLSEFISTPLTLSYLLIVFIKKHKGNGNSILKIDSSYKLHQEVLYSIRQHYVNKPSSPKERAKYNTTFDRALVEGGRLAYAMEKRFLFAVNTDNPLVGYKGGYETLLNLSQVGVGRLEFIAKDKQKEILEEENRNSRFSFLTVTIQEYLAACNFTELVSDASIKLFLNFFTKHTNWNFCKMVIGKYVADKEVYFLQELHQILQQNWLQHPNIYNVYRYMLFLGELDEKTLKKSLTHEHLRQLFKETINSILERPVWKPLLYGVLSRIILKLSFFNKKKFVELYCAHSIRHLNILLDAETLPLSSFRHIETMIDIAEVSIVHQNSKLIESILNWILRINDVIIAIEQRLNVENHNDELLLLVDKLIEIAKRYTFILEQSGQKGLTTIGGQLNQILGLRWKAWHPTIKSLLEIFLIKQDTSSYQDNLNTCWDSLTSDAIAIHKIPFLLEKLDWSAQQTFQYHQQISATNCKEAGELIQYIISQVQEIKLDQKWLQLIVRLLNRFPHASNYALLFDLLEAKLDHQDVFFIESAYTVELENFIGNFIQTYQNLATDDEKIIALHYVVKGLYYIQPSTIIYSKYRLFFYESFEWVIQQHWSHFEAYTQKKTSSNSILDSFFYYYQNWITRNDFLDSKFVINQLLDGPIFSHPLIQEQVLVQLFLADMPLYEDKYWNYFKFLWKRTQNADWLIQLLNNDAIYLFRENLPFINQCWEWLGKFPSIKLSNPFQLFTPVVQVFTMLEKHQLDDEQSFLILETITGILEQEVLQEAIIHLENKPLQTQGLLSYLLLLRFNSDAHNSYLIPCLKETNYNKTALFKHLIMLFDSDEIDYLESAIPSETYKLLQNFYHYYEENDIHIHSTQHSSALFYR